MFTSKPADPYKKLKGKSILVVIKGFDRNPDIIEDWLDYKRYVWQVCHFTGKQRISTRRVKGQDASYLKYEKKCCNTVFDTNANNIIIGYSDPQICPIPNHIKFDTTN